MWHKKFVRMWIWKNLFPLEFFGDWDIGQARIWLGSSFSGSLPLLKLNVSKYLIFWFLNYLFSLLRTHSSYMKLRSKVNSNAVLTMIVCSYQTYNSWNWDI